MAVLYGTLSIYQLEYSQFPYTSSITVYDGEVKEAVEKAYKNWRSSPEFDFNQAVANGIRFIVNLPERTIIYSSSTVTVIDPDTHIF
ncbi:hypothetical protein AGMMS49991_07750 [Spirochaetia bacterium]|nr:hypothetical protein AGMMS49991_07750 [Spirochaetia bacterium]